MSLSDIVYNIRHAVYAKKVREAIASAIEEISNKEDKNLETYNNMVIGAGESNAEIVDARLDNNTGTRYEKVGKRLDKISSEIDETTNRLSNIVAQAGTDNTEIVDMRTIDSTTYATSGDALRAIHKSVINLENDYYNIKNIYEQGTVNGLGLNTSGTTYPVEGGYASKPIQFPDEAIGLYIVSIEKVILYNANGVSKKLITSNGFIPRCDMYAFAYSIKNANVNIAEIYIVYNEYALYEKKIKTDRLILEEIFDSDEAKKFSKNYEQILSCFAIRPKNIYEQGTVNGLGLNTSGTTYPVEGGYASDFININNNCNAIYVKNCRYLQFKDSDGNLKLVDTINVNNYPININYVSFRYSVTKSNTYDAVIFQYSYTDFPTGMSETTPDVSLKNEKINLKDLILSIKEYPIKEIACYGNSLTEGAGSGNAGVYSYPSQLSNLIANKNSGYIVANRGIGGETSDRILMRQGCYSNFDMVAPFTIPADTTPVKIVKTGDIGKPISNNTTIKNGINPVTIKGIRGNLSYDDGYYFTRIESGNSVEVSRPTQLWTNSALEDKGKILVSCIGQNDNKESPNFVEDIIRKHRAMINFNGSGKYIVLGLPTGTESNRHDLELGLKKEFGSNFLNIREYLFNFGLSDNNLEETEEDKEDIANGIIPRQLRSDDVHLNRYGYYAMAKAIYSLGQELEYWK